MEAGGQATDFRGLPIYFSANEKLANNYGIVATNGRLHSQALNAIAHEVELLAILSWLGFYQ